MRRVALGLVLAMLLVGRPALAGVEAGVEAGVVFASRNDARLPGELAASARWSLGVGVRP
jgi:hypothetical protein